MRGTSWIGYRFIVFAITLVLAVPPNSIPARTAKQKDEPPLWRVQINQLAQVSIPFRLCLYCLQADYLDNSTLAVTMLTTDMSPSALKHGSPSVSGPYKYRTAFLDANSGQVQATHDWNSETMYLLFTPTHDGKFLLETFGEIALYSREFAELKRSKFAEPGHLSREGSSRVGVSWDGKSFWIASANRDQMTVRLFDADTFEMLSSWSTALTSPMWFVSGSDNGVAVSMGDNASVVFAGQTWKTIFTTSNEPPLSVLSVNFANNGLLLMTRGNRVIGVDAGGTRLFETDFSPAQLSLSTRSSRGGRAFVVQTDQFLLAYQGQFAMPPPSASSPDAIAVYAARDGRAIFQRSLRTESGRPIGNIAVSPDATSVAVLSGGLANRPDGVVEVFRIPHVDGVN
jgi:WD40 repeat protein